MQNITLGGTRRKNKTLKSKIRAGILILLFIFLSVYKPKIKQLNVLKDLGSPKAQEIE